MPVLYLISDFFYLLIYYVFKYRREIVFKNLAIAFPDKSTEERVKIAKGFYRNFTDTFIESLKLISAGKRFVEKRSEGDFAILDQLIEKGYSINAMVGHQFNWEFANHLYAMHFKIPFVGIYMPISNKILDRIFYKFRERFGTILISAPDFRNKMHNVFDRQFVLGLAADQNPGNPHNAHWLNFFGRPTPFLTGPAKGAVKNNAAVVFIGMRKPKRGRFRYEATLLTEQAGNQEAVDLTKAYKNALEETIRQEPSNYLWSHRRFKWEWKPEYGEVH